MIPQTYSFTPVESSIPRMSINYDEQKRYQTKQTGSIIKTKLKYLLLEDTSIRMPETLIARKKHLYAEIRF